MKRGKKGVTKRRVLAINSRQEADDGDGKPSQTLPRI